MKLFGSVSIAAAAAMCLALTSGTQSDAGSSMPVPLAYSDTDAYDVYSAVLPMDSWYWQNSKTLLIVQEIPPKEWPIGSPRGALQGNAEFAQIFDGIFKSFEEANREPQVLEYRLTIRKPYKMLSNAELDTSFRRRSPNAPASDGWEGFRESFPDSKGYLILSGVGFNSDKNVAVVYVEHRCGGLCASARYYILKKRDGRWVRYTPKGLGTEMTAES